MIRSRENALGAWAFLAGIVLSVIVGIFSVGESIDPYYIWALFGLGGVVGYFVPEKDVKTFLLASSSLVIVSFVGVSGMVQNSAIQGVRLSPSISSILGTLLILFVPATIIVALKTVFSISRISVREERD